MMALNISDDPNYWLKTCRGSTLANQMMDHETKSIMLGIAKSYEKIAKWVEDRISGSVSHASRLLSARQVNRDLLP
jgi:hypothetical protein